MKVWVVVDIWHEIFRVPKVFDSKEKAISEAKQWFKQETGKEVETLSEIRITNFQKKEEMVYYQTNYNDEDSFFVEIFEEEVN